MSHHIPDASGEPSLYDGVKQEYHIEVTSQFLPNEDHRVNIQGTTETILVIKGRPHRKPMGPKYSEGTILIFDRGQWEITESRKRGSEWIYFALPWPECPPGMQPMHFTEEEVQQKRRRSPRYSIDDTFRDEHREKWYVRTYLFEADDQNPEWHYEVLHLKGKLLPHWQRESNLHRWKLLSHNLQILDIDLLPAGEVISVAFDGADEVDSGLNCIKGGGACLFQEKIVAVQAKKFVVVADFRKISPTLCTPTTWPSGIPIEVVPSSYPYVTSKLLGLGATNVVLRPGGKAKAGPCVTDNGNFLLDAVFPPLGEGSDVVQELAEAIKGIVGVVEHGLFYGGSKGWKGRPEVAYFGMEDGAVKLLATNG